MLKYVVAAAVVVLIAAVIVAIFRAAGPKDNEQSGVKPDAFQQQKKGIHPNCSREAFFEFFDFLKKYPGGYCRWKNGEIVYRDYSGQEKGDLKGIFYNAVIPNPNLFVEDKEEFRVFIISKGVSGLNARPNYETRDSKLKNRNADADDYERKEVGNKGEELVRNRLNILRDRGYLVINGPVLEANGQRVEYDHIVIGNNGVFSLETKAFGASKDGKNKASLFIDKGDKWILRKNGTNRELKSPTEQIHKEQEHLKSILHAAKERIDVKPVLVLSNSELFLKNNITLDYEVVSVNDLVDCITGAHVSRIVEEEKLLIAQIIDDHRVNA